MIGTIFEWLLGQKSIEHVLRRNVKVQLFVIILLVGGTAWGTIWLYQIHWEWRNIQDSVKSVKTEQAQEPLAVSNAVVGAIAPLKVELKRDEAIQTQYNRKMDRVLDYIDDKDGKNLDFTKPLTNHPVASTFLVVTNDP